ncbi:hypothetical protein M080_6024, partial [Bacteroides fragilis str. 3397 T10]
MSTAHTLVIGIYVSPVAMSISNNSMATIPS